jgi:glucose/arabinose dehydrogenase
VTFERDPARRRRHRARPWILFSVLVSLLAVFALVARPAARRLGIEGAASGYHRPDVRNAGASLEAPHGLDWVQVAKGLHRPTDLQFVPGGGGLAIVLEQGGTARLLDLSHAADPARPVVTPASDVLTLDVRSDSECGLLGLAFHPRYRENGRVFVDSTPAGGELRSRIAEWKVPPEELGKRPAHDERVLLEVAQPYSNHKAGQLAFGPDGFLYVGFGDGGFRADPHGNGQNKETLLGKMLRIDVDLRSAGAYGVPKDNPFIGVPGARPEIWALGLRNPWRFSFDPRGRLVVADVGQNRYEEIDLVARGDNLGWRYREATHCFNPEKDCPTEGLVDPIFEYGRESGSCVTGGYVYTGSSIPGLSGRYVFADFVSGVLYALTLPNADIPENGLREATKLGQWRYLISSFGRDDRGELYAVDYSEGGVYLLTTRSIF